MIKQHHHVRIVDNRLFYDFAADNILYLLRYHADTCPEFTGCLIHKLDVLRHERTGDGFPCLFDDQDFATLLDTHFLKEYIHDNQRNKREKERIIFYTVDFKDDEGLIEQ